MASWKLIVENYGKIKSAEIEMAPLTLFVGDNNSGKSYLLSLLWGIQNVGMDTILDGDAMMTEQINELGDWIVNQIDITLENKKHTIIASEIADLLERALNSALEKNKNKIVKKIFNSENITIGKLAIKLIDLCDTVFNFELEPSGVFKVFGRNTKTANLVFGEGVLSHLDYRTNIIIREALLRTFFGILLDGAVTEGRTNHSIYLPAARTGFMLTKDIINKAGREKTFNLSDDNKEITPFIRPINQFLDIIGDLSVETTDNKKALTLVENIENEMANGTIKMSTIPNKEVLYVPVGYKKGIPLRMSSAVITEISPLILILKHKRFVERFYYEEPEMCLHPQLQYKMGKMLGRIVNGGINMVVTTHSDIILQHINNMIKLSNHNDCNMICDNLGYTEQDLLSCEQVKVYQFEAKKKGKSIVKELLCGKDGFVVPTFNNAL